MPKELLAFICSSISRQYMLQECELQPPQLVLNKILEVDVCVLVLFPVLVYFVRQSSLSFPILQLLQSSSSREEPCSMWLFSRSEWKTVRSVGPSHLQYSVPLFKVTHVALLTQGALSSMHCRAATDNNK